MTESERLTFETELGISIDKNEDCPTMSICWNCDIKVKDCKYFNDVVEKLAKYEAIGTIDEFKAYKQGNCTNNCKHYDSTAEYVRNKTIDEFVKQMSQEFLRNDEDGNLYIFAWIDDFKKIAEQMKAGGKNE